MQPDPYRKKLRNLIYFLGGQDFCLVFGLIAGCHARAYCKRLISHHGSFQPMRMLLIYSFVLPPILYFYYPSPCNPSPDLLEAWSYSLLACLGFYHLLP